MNTNTITMFKVPTWPDEIIKFRSGPPPHIGWWKTRLLLADKSDAQIYLWRWWNGHNWSAGVASSYTPKLASVAASKHVFLLPGESIEWSYFWPHGPRVPRIDPYTGIITSPRWGPFKRAQS